MRMYYMMIGTTATCNPHAEFKGDHLTGVWEGVEEDVTLVSGLYESDADALLYAGHLASHTGNDAILVYRLAAESDAESGARATCASAVKEDRAYTVENDDLWKFVPDRDGEYVVFLVSQDAVSTL